jgi:hypothetical protein
MASNNSASVMGFAGEAAAMPVLGSGAASGVG